jgi:hypothetical protein
LTIVHPAVQLSACVPFAQQLRSVGRDDTNLFAARLAESPAPRHSGTDKIVAFDQGQSLDEFMPLPDANSAGTSDANKVVTLRSNFGKKSRNSMD